MKGKVSCLLLVALALACGSRTATRSGAGGAGATAEALSWVGCGPTDGPAVVILIAEGKAACADRLTLQAGDHVDIELWSGTYPSPGQTVVLQGSAGAASVCRGGTCTSLVGATVTFDPNDGTGWTGTLRYVEGGAPKTKTFHTAECVVQQLCG